MKNFLIIYTLSIIIILLLAYYSYLPINYTGEVIIRSVTTDKDVYHSGDEMKINVFLNEHKNTLTLMVNGIKDKYGEFRVARSYMVSPNEKWKNITIALPSCYGCSGVSPGNYTIYIILFSGDRLIDSFTKQITLEK
ncbi:MAG: hypothetical protein DRP15_01040 [Candidatus Aenigmatarchaeota archaeon]|nr:MAG: hypothetical protein DRP15_01040 [Candidatus Aenigmarchaeota archaeon]